MLNVNPKKIYLKTEASSLTAYIVQIVEGIVTPNFQKNIVKCAGNYYDWSIIDHKCNGQDSDLLHTFNVLIWDSRDWNLYVWDTLICDLTILKIEVEMIWVI